jgi:hypothetical protein
MNPDWSNETDIMHLRFHGVQVSLFTPEEVQLIDGSVPWGSAVNDAAVVNLGQTNWLQSFAQQHLSQCSHFRVMFYDYYLDVICKVISAHEGHFK